MRFNVTIPRQYRDANNAEKTHFWTVGTAWPLKNREGISIKLYSKLLVTDQLVLFPAEEEETASTTPPPQADDIPF
jgi:hypothetical protein